LTSPSQAATHLSEKEWQTLVDFVQGLRGLFDGQVQSVILFGSRSRGEAEPDSDMDVVVVLCAADAQTVRQVRHLAVEVWLKHDIYVSTRVWSEAHWRRLGELETLLYQNIRRDGIDLLELASSLG
jgi:predicted nucleotidyltransferase